MMLLYISLGITPAGQTRIMERPYQSVCTASSSLSEMSVYELALQVT